MICPKCQNYHHNVTPQCNNCGTRFQPNPNIQQNPRVAQMGSNTPKRANKNAYNQQSTIDTILPLVGKNRAYYSTAFDKVENDEKTFNLCAFLFTGLFLSYHKMYKPMLLLLKIYIFGGIAIMLTSLILSAVITSIDITIAELSLFITPIILISIFSLCIMFYFAFNFNRVFYEHLSSIIDNSKYQSKQDAIIFKITNSGVESRNVWIMFIPILNFIYGINLIVKGFKQHKALEYSIIK